MSNQSTPRHTMAIAELIDHESCVLKTYGPQRSAHVAKQLRRICDILEKKI